MTFGHKFYDHMSNIYDLDKKFMTKDKKIFMTLGHIVYDLWSYYDFKSYFL